MTMIIRLLLLLIINVATASAEEDYPFCKYTTAGEILPSNSPCLCDSETICNLNEMCATWPTDEAWDTGLLNDCDFAEASCIETAFSENLVECFPVPCDDLSGQWVWYGRNPRAWSPGDFTVWATVDIQQDNCQFVLTSSSNVGSDGVISNNTQTREYYGVLLPMELTSFNLFDTQDELDSFLSPSPDNFLGEDGYFFTQDFGNSAPGVQCSLFGSLVYKGDFVAEGATPEGVDSWSGSLARVDGNASIGETIPEAGEFDDWASNGGCPEGYPRPWESKNVGDVDIAASPSPKPTPTPISGPSTMVVEQPLPTTNETTGTCTSDNDCTATVRSRFPMQSSSGGVDLCQCYSASSVDPFDECEGEDDSTCKIAKCANTCEGLEGYCSDDGMCALRPISDEFTPSPTSSGTTAPVAMTKNTPAPIGSPAGATVTPSTSSPSISSTSAPVAMTNNNTPAPITSSDGGDETPSGASTPSSTNSAALYWWRKPNDVAIKLIAATTLVLLL